MNNGRMFRRQSSGTNPGGLIQNAMAEQPANTIVNRGDKANAWVRRMRFVMAQANPGNPNVMQATNMQNNPVATNPTVMAQNALGSSHGMGMANT